MDLGKDECRSADQTLSENVLTLTSPFLNKGRNIAIDNFFTSINLVEKLKIKDLLE